MLQLEIRQNIQKRNNNNDIRKSKCFVLHCIRLDLEFLVCHVIEMCICCTESSQAKACTFALCHRKALSVSAAGHVDSKSRQILQHILMGVGDKV